MKNGKNILETTKELIAKHFNIDPKRIHEESNLSEDLQADSLDIIEIIMDVEHAFDIAIIDEQMPKTILVQDIVTYVQKAH